MDARDRAALHGGAKDHYDFEIYDDDGEVVEVVKVPYRMEVCDLCHGEGKHINPAIDANGIEGRRFAEDPEFAEAYFGGAYDVVCYECHGRNVVRVPNVEALGDEHKEAWYARIEDERDDRLMREAEMRMGA